MMNLGWACDLLDQRECRERDVVQVLSLVLKEPFLFPETPCKGAHDSFLEDNNPCAESEVQAIFSHVSHPS